MNTDEIIATYVTRRFVDLFFDAYPDFRDRYRLTEALLEDDLDDLDADVKSLVIDVVGDHMERYR